MASLDLLVLTSSINLSSHATHSCALYSVYHLTLGYTQDAASIPSCSLSSMQRFGVEGCEAVLVGLETLVARCAQHGVCRIELGMPHRGRLNVLCNILKKPPGALYGEMEGGQSEFHVGDVKYHLGQSASLEFAAEVSVAAMHAVCNSCAKV